MKIYIKPEIKHKEIVNSGSISTLTLADWMEGYQLEETGITTYLYTSE